MLWIILITAFAAIPILSQETPPVPKINSASVSVSTAAASNGGKLIGASTDCEQDLATANQRLLKTLDALEQAEKSLTALQSEIAAREKLSMIDAELLKKKDEIISNQEKLIKILEKQTGRKISFLFGLIKVRY